MGELSKGTRTTRPPGFAAPVPPPLVRRPARQACLWVGMVLGALGGIAVVSALAILGPALAVSFRGAVLGALTGVLLAPVIAICLFTDMMILPWSISGMIGDSTWSRLARALQERRFGPLVVPLFIFLVLPMGLLGLGGSQMTAISAASHVTAGLGAILLGGFVGGLCGSSAGKSRWTTENPANREIDVAFLTGKPK